MADVDTQENTSDDKTMVRHRKRRTSSSLVIPTEDTEQTSHLSNTKQAPTTPTKSKKRIRFSDPGPSTSLTPAMRRSKLAVQVPTPNPPSLRLNQENPKRGRSARKSLPASYSSSIHYSPVPFYISGELQFKPLRQILDERTKRRIRRNNLSEEMNDYYADKKSRAQWDREIQALKEELAQARSQANATINGEDHERVRELEQELVTVKQELLQRSPTLGPSIPAYESFNQPTAGQNIFDDNHDENDIPMVNLDEDVAVQDHASFQETAEAATQVSLPSPSHTALFQSTRMSLEYLFPGEIPLGLKIQDPEPIINIMLDRLQASKAQVAAAATAVSTAKTQEANMRRQFNFSVGQLDRARSNAEALSRQVADEKTRLNQAERKIQRTELSIDQGSEKIRSLEAGLDEKQRSIEKLKDALESYRVEVAKLEQLVNHMEEEHSHAISKLRAEMDEAVTDLECHVAAEMTGRRAAEQEAVDRAHRIKQLEQSEQELKGAISEKQRIIRDLENEITNAKEKSEKEIGVMNVTVGRITSSLEEAHSALNILEGDRQRLLAGLEEEKVAGMQAIEAMQAEIAECSEKAEFVKVAHAKDMQDRGSAAAQHSGLLTPVSTHKFKDAEVPGYVLIKRGKGNGRRRPDSGIGVLEEDEFEDFFDTEMTSSAAEGSSPLKNHHA